MPGASHCKIRNLVFHQRRKRQGNENDTANGDDDKCTQDWKQVRELIARRRIEDSAQCAEQENDDGE